MKITNFITTARAGADFLVDEHPQDKQKRLDDAQTHYYCGLVVGSPLEEKLRTSFYRTLREERDYAERNKQG